MTKFVELIAPRGIAAWIISYCLFALAIVKVNTLALTIIANRAVDVVEDVVMPLVVGTPFIFVFLCSVSHMAKLQAALRHQAMTDELTGLPTRRAFLDGDQSAGTTVVLAIDIDWFKSINDRFGHIGGDRCLVLFAQHLRETVREGDRVARIGGEEFAVLLRDADPAKIRTIGERISRGITIDPAGTGEMINVSASVGMARLDAPATLEEAFTKADKALYQAKRTGRARVVDAEAA